MSILRKYGYRPKSLDVPENSEEFLSFLGTRPHFLFECRIGEKMNHCMECGDGFYDISDLNIDMIEFSCSRCKRTCEYQLSNFEKEDLSETIRLFRGIANLPKSEFRRRCLNRIDPKNFEVNGSVSDSELLNQMGFRVHGRGKYFSIASRLFCQWEPDRKIKLKNAEIRSRRISQTVKDQVWNRDGGKCVECGSKENLEFDHIIPFSKGGSNTYRNIQLLCESCNRSKSNKIG